MIIDKKLVICIFSLPVCNAVLADFRDIPLFLMNAFKQPNIVGAILPCTSGVGKELTRCMVRSQRVHPEHPLRILEVGAGTGAMTEIIVGHVRDIDQVDVVEISPEFCSVLHDKFDKYKNLSIHCMSIIDWHPEQAYDFIISTLPFNSFDYELMDSIINHLTLLIKSGGVLSYVAYAGIAQLKKPFLWGKKRADHKRKMKRLKEWRRQYKIAKKTIIKNVPPINIYHLCIEKNATIAISR